MKCLFACSPLDQLSDALAIDTGGLSPVGLNSLIDAW